ncbi:MAG: winged helix-turn-helix domain-containing protein [Candidatus Nealsonbacteria bacterium DGGOD1a]|jgi:Predicted transcriptional regulators|nr:MAG: winged helix-turn-helix domain-containing protein [Candidatus Nealsonbacteria bacterium DGGOD1a]
MEEAEKQKTAKQLERYFKGVANHRRIDILLLIAKKEGIKVEDIANILDVNFKTISEHVRRLVQAGLVNKNYQGRQVAQTLSPYGKRFVEFIRTFQHS